MGTVPNLAEVRSWLGLSTGTISDDQLTRIYDGELSLQAQMCCIPADPDAYPPEAAEGLFRRVGRAVASRSVPLGMVGVDSEYGASRLPPTDAEIARVEAPIRRMVLG